MDYLDEELISPYKVSLDVVQIEIVSKELADPGYFCHIYEHSKNSIRE